MMQRSDYRCFGGIFDIDVKQERLEEVERELEAPEVWNNPEEAQKLSQERAQLKKMIDTFEHLSQSFSDIKELIEMTASEDDEAGLTTVLDDLKKGIAQLEQLEFQRMFSQEMDVNNTYVDIQAGSGGTEAQDWAEMLLRMYLRYTEQKGFQVTLEEVSPGDVAGIKSATIHVAGEYAFGWLRTETGVHRLVRKSPFDSNNKRHTSFASVFVSPEVDDNIDIDINPADLKIDTYRASGAGGQHVNRTDSAIRITHLPTNTVVQCQSDRSQHKNRASAMKQLKAKLYELEMQKRNAEKQLAESNKSDIGWGSQIRSYVLDESRIKDLRTHVENHNTKAVLDGDLDGFIEASLRMGIEEK